MTDLTTFQLGRWTVDPSRNQLINGRKSVTLEPRVMDVLVALANAGTATSSRDELLAQVWPGVHVVEGVLARAIYQLRLALGDEAGRVETVRGRGYRLTEPVRPAERALVRKAPLVRFREMAAFAAVLIACLLALSASPLANGPQPAIDTLQTDNGAQEPLLVATTGPELVPVMSLAEERAANIAANREALRREREAVRPSWEESRTHAGTPQPDPAPGAPPPGKI